MPLLDLKHVKIFYELSGPANRPVLMFSNSLGTSLAMWEPQVAPLGKDFRILRYDKRGHGRSSVPPGSYSVAELADDVIALLDQLGIAQVDFCGLSIGGMIGMSLALRVPHRLRKLILCNTAPKIGSDETWNARIAAVRQGGMSAVVESVLERWFSPKFRSTSPAAIESTRQMLLGMPVEGYVATCAAVRDLDARESIAGIGVPTLIISGTLDPVATVRDGQFMAERIRGSCYRELPAAHLSNIEAPDAFTMEVSGFLKA